MLSIILMKIGTERVIVALIGLLSSSAATLTYDKFADNVEQGRIASSEIILRGLDKLETGDKTASLDKCVGVFDYSQNRGADLYRKPFERALDTACRNMGEGVAYHRSSERARALGVNLARRELLAGGQAEEICAKSGLGRSVKIACDSLRADGFFSRNNHRYDFARDLTKGLLGIGEQDVMKVTSLCANADANDYSITKACRELMDLGFFREVPADINYSPEYTTAKN